MSINQESLGGPEYGEPEQELFERVRADAEALAQADTSFNHGDWSRIDGRGGHAYISKQNVVKNLPSWEARFRQEGGTDVSVLLVHRVPSPLDYEQRTHIFHLGSSFISSSHLVDVQEYEYHMYQSYEGGPPVIYDYQMDDEELLDLHDILWDIRRTPTPKPSVFRRAASWLIHH